MGFLLSILLYLILGQAFTQFPTLQLGQISVVLKIQHFYQLFSKLKSVRRRIFVFGQTGGQKLAFLSIYSLSYLFSLLSQQLEPERWGSGIIVVGLGIYLGKCLLRSQELKQLNLLLTKLINGACLRQHHEDSKHQSMERNGKYALTTISYHLCTALSYLDSPASSTPYRTARLLRNLTSPLNLESNG